MPLYDYRCLTCEAPSTQLVKHADATVACPACGSLNVERALSLFAFRSAAAAKPTAPEATTAARPGQERHVCTSGCQHGQADALVKKYLD